jgi:hypothetical protein
MERVHRAGTVDGRGGPCNVPVRSGHRRAV